jgi:hypothetical protein
MSKQLEINFFWPLTEQIPLDLVKDRTIIKLINIADDCHRAVKDLNDPDLEMRLKLVANLVAGILNDYKDKNQS